MKPDNGRWPLWLNLACWALLLIGASNLIPKPYMDRNCRYVNWPENIYAAIQQCPMPGTVFVGPGLFSNGITNCAREGLTLVLNAGTIISNGVGSRFLDNSGAGNPLATNFNLLGFGKIIQTANNTAVNGIGAIMISNADSQCTIQ